MSDNQATEEIVFFTPADRIVTGEDTLQLISRMKEKLNQCRGQLVMLIPKSSYSYSDRNGRQCRQDTKTIMMGIIKGDELEFNENGEFTAPKHSYLVCKRIDFDWEKPGSNLIKQKEEALKIFSFDGLSFSGKEWIVKYNAEQKLFLFHAHDSSTSASNELIIGDEDVNTWLNQGEDCYRNWGYRPLAYLISNFLDHPIEATDIIRESFANNTIPCKNLQIVLNYHMETLYRRSGNDFASVKTLDELLKLLPDGARQSNVGQLYGSPMDESTRNMIIG
ncbi:MAG: hypothetical protein ABIH48_02050 [Candidatus Falkowbacteria bacterium]